MIESTNYCRREGNSWRGPECNCESGLVVGSFIGEDGNSHGFLAEGAIFSTVDRAEGANTSVWGVNAAGQIAGHL